VLLASAVFEGSSWWIALKEFRETKGNRSYFQAFRDSKDPSTFTVLLEDSAALIGLLIALIGVAGAHLLHDPRFDGFASIGIGAVLAITSLLLARETKDLLIGETADAKVRKSIMEIAEADPEIHAANGVLAVQLGPNNIVAALSIEFEDGLTTSEIEICVKRVELAIRCVHADIVALYVKPQTPETWRKRARTTEPSPR
jgi:divalent metal cation (Fe/Co/Zn/Cd) transporter